MSEKRKKDRLETISKSAHAFPWHIVLAQILDVCNPRVASGKRAAGNATQYQRRKMLMRIFRTLRQRTPYKLSNPFRIGEKHVKALASLWINDQLAPKSIVSLLSTLRIFCGWIGKPGMVREPAYYSNDLRVSQVNRTDKSWQGNGVDFASLLPSIAQRDTYVGMQAKAMHAFGLRVKEAVCLRPVAAQIGDVLHVTAGTKGGRPRLVPIDTLERRAAIDELKAFALAHGKSGGIAQPGRSLKSQMRRVYYVFRVLGLTRVALGVTAHGLRHEYAITELEEHGVTAPVRGGVRPPMPQPQLDQVLLRVSEQLGHSRTSITAAYYGSFAQPNQYAREVMASEAGRTKLQQIEAMLAHEPLDQRDRMNCKQMLDAIARDVLELEEKALLRAQAEGQPVDSSRLVVVQRALATLEQQL